MDQKPKSQLSSITVWISILAVVTGALQEIGSLHIFPDANVAKAVSIMGAIMYGLRAYTAEPITKFAAKRVKK